MSAFPSTIIRFIPPTVIKDDAEYDKVFAKYYNSGSKPVYRIEYYYPFDPMAINGEPNQYFVNVTELDMCIVLLATQPNFIQYKVNNTNGQYCRKRYEIETDSGVLFFRNNVLVSYMPGFNFDNFRDNIYDLSTRAPRHSPKKNRLSDIKVEIVKPAEPPNACNGCVIL
ncbi:hypothetical protein GGF37_001364 [Kickxella alabastrina]|nr:hypothetical protein GGF37_001364 [Kickxella alabastrina]